MADNQEYKILFRKCKICGEDYQVSNKNTYYCKLCDSRKSVEWQKNNKDKHKISTQKWYARNKERVKITGKVWLSKNKERNKAYVKKWREENPEKCKEYQNRGNKKIRSTIKGRINDAFSSAMYRSIRENKQGRHWESLVGYTVEDLKKHIERQFKEGMSWENYGKYTWHIDHIIPVDVFNITNAECIDFKRCWALSNLQPLEAKKNHAKKNRIITPFQPSLSLEIANVRI